MLRDLLLLVVGRRRLVEECEVVGLSEESLEEDLRERMEVEVVEGWCFPVRMEVVKGGGVGE